MILLDSDVLIAHLRGTPRARDWLLRARRDSGRLATSAVSVAEVAGGMRSQERHEVTRLLSSLDIFPVSERVGWKAAELMRTYRRSHPGIGLGDFLIAATVATEGLQLATLNVRHFPMFPGLRPPFVLSRPGHELQ
ncbi:MAG: type II toxin-antitoxin system VapC family toxin [Acidimicrobiales bacterium]